MGKSTLLPKWFLVAAFTATAGILGGLAVVAPSSLPGFKTSLPGRILRFLHGEPVATQDINDAADKIIASAWESELLALSDQLMMEYGPIATSLPYEMFGDGYLLPLKKLPEKFHELGWSRSGDPAFILRVDEKTSKPTEIVLSWGNMRHAVIIYAQPPTVAPQGFFVRQVGDRIYIVAIKKSGLPRF